MTEDKKAFFTIQDFEGTPGNWTTLKYGDSEISELACVLANAKVAPLLEELARLKDHNNHLGISLDNLAHIEKGYPQNVQHWIEVARAAEERAENQIYSAVVEAYKKGMSDGLNLGELNS